MRSPSHVVVLADVSPALLTAERSRDFPGTDETLSREHVSVVLCSSMTRAEIEVSQQTLGITQPFICESGAAVLVPHGYFPFDVPRDRDLTGHHVVEFGRSYAEVVAQLHRTSTRLGIPVVGFRDMSVGQVAAECGISLSHARLAKLREYDEPFRLVNPSLVDHDRLWRSLRNGRLTLTSRGRLEHVGAPVARRMGIALLINLYRRAFGSTLTVDLRSERTAAPSHQEAWVDTVVELAWRARTRTRLGHC